LFSHPFFCSFFQFDLRETVNGGTLEELQVAGLYRLVEREKAARSSPGKEVQPKHRTVAKVSIARPLFHALNAVLSVDDEAVLPQDLDYTLHDTMGNDFEKLQLYSMVGLINLVRTLNKDQYIETLIRPGSITSKALKLPSSWASEAVSPDEMDVLVLKRRCWPHEVDDGLYPKQMVAGFTEPGSEGVDSWIKFPNGKIIYMQSKGAQQISKGSKHFEPKHLRTCIGKFNHALSESGAPDGILEIVTCKRAPMLSRAGHLDEKGCILVCNIKDEIFADDPDAMQDQLGLLLGRMFMRKVNVADAAGKAGAGGGRAAIVAAAAAASSSGVSAEGDEEDPGPPRHARVKSHSSRLAQAGTVAKKARRHLSSPRTAPPAPPTIPTTGPSRSTRGSHGKDGAKRRKVGTATTSHKPL